MKRFVLPVEEDDNGDAFVSLPQDLLDDLQWKAGDHLEYSDEGDGSILVYKIDE
ncbi:hypothetical protein CYXG_00052 [Synechococcus phage S-SSM4]|jgi:antitoxin component of MazEF toxin-antitoxin module|uniref:SpoVT-AbrB domain-containing protein n=1 Tax=Synechococcus phage S-SSM4 TaxID=536466 RepID=M1U9D6_9CAUD|nr:hypothetical protein CYXG_00052 [Synechococcus phage S-SSM4]AGG54116.1 hypothetical protein CYXG_00052 [Synechococcus phage S-SSM4]AGG54306.1 hypothetical protein CYWG_00022 [Cyanophage S-SSM6b]